MKAWLAATAAAILLAAAAGTEARAADEALKVCLDEDLPPLSAHHRGKPDSGFDVALAQAVAERLGRPLKIQWFESKLDEEFEPGARSQCPAFRWPLRAGRQLCPDQGLARGARRQNGEAAGFRWRYPRRSPPPHAARRAGAEPALYLFAADGRARREGARPQDRRRRRSRRAAHRDRKRHAWRRHPDDFRKRTADRRHHASGPGRDDLLGALDRGDFDATLLDLRRFDAYRAAHPDTKLAASGYYYPIGANRGYVGLASDPSLLVAVNEALSELQAAGTIAELGRAVGLTYLPPREPAILGDVWLKILQKQD